jgi:WD40 repeat protein
LNWGLSGAPFPPDLARLYGVPELPPHYLPRETHLAVLKQKLITGGANVGITGQSSAVGVQGMGGIGKSVLAAALARDLEVRQAFHDGIYWLTIGQEPKLLDLQNQFLRQLTGSKETFSTEREAKDALREALEGRTALIVIDDAWTIDAAYAFAVSAPPVRLIIATRNQEILVGLGAEEYRVDVLSPRDALKMLTEWVGLNSPDKLPTEAVEVAKECGYLPLALAMIGAMIRLRPAAWKDAITRLQRADLGAIKNAFPNYPYPDLLRAIEISIEDLEAADRERYLDLAMFPEDQPIPEEASRVLWNLDEVDTRDCMMRFVARSLGTWATDGTSLILHDLQRDLIHKRREKDLPDLHLRLVEAWDALPKLPDAYAWRWIAYHLVKAGRKDDLRRLLLDFNYLQGKIAATDTDTLIADYEYLLEDKDLRLVQSAIRLSSNILARDQRQLASQLTGRLVDRADTGIEALLTHTLEKAPRPWLRVLKSSLSAASGPLIRVLEGHTSDAHAAAVTPDGRHVVSGSGDHTLRVWDLATGETKMILQGHTGEVYAVAVTPDGRHVVSGSGDHTLRVWDLAAGETKMILRGHTDSVKAVAVAPDGRHLVSGSDDRTLRVWDLETGEIKKVPHGPSWWKDAKRQWIAQSKTGVSAVVVTPDGRHAVGPDDKTLRVWDLATGETKTTLGRHASEVNALAITPDGRRVISGSADGTLRVWDLATEQTTMTLQSHAGKVNAVAITPDGRHVVSSSYDNTLRIWDLATGETTRTFQGHASSVSAVAVTPDGNRVVSGSRDQTLRLWDLATEETKTALQGLTHVVNAVAVTPDGRHVVSGSYDAMLRVWDLATGETKMTFEGHTHIVNAVAVTPDGRRVVSGSSDKTLRVLGLAPGEINMTLRGHAGEVNAVAITPDGRRVISGSADTTLRVWDLATGQTKMTLKGHAGGVNAVAITADARHVVSGSEDQHVARLGPGDGANQNDAQRPYQLRQRCGNHTRWSSCGLRLVGQDTSRGLRFQ